MKDWWIFTGSGEPHDGISRLPAPPSWRAFTNVVDKRLGANGRGAAFQVGPDEIDLINAALYLRRPLFITGKPGSGKSTLAYAVAHELQLGPVLHWMITSRSTLQEGLYYYDAVGHLQAAALTKQGRHTRWDIGAFIRLGPLGTALLPSDRPRVLLIDEIDKSDIDLPNDLLNVLEEGAYTIPELSPERSSESKAMVRQDYGSAYDDATADEPVAIVRGRVRCAAFPLIVMTSNGEREFPAAFMRRCLHMTMREPDVEKLPQIVRAHIDLDPQLTAEGDELIANFASRMSEGDLAADQLLNAIYLATSGHAPIDASSALYEALVRYLNTQGS